MCFLASCGRHQHQHRLRPEHLLHAEGITLPRPLLYGLAAELGQDVQQLEHCMSHSPAEEAPSALPLSPEGAVTPAASSAAQRVWFRYRGCRRSMRMTTTSPEALSSRSVSSLLPACPCAYLIDSWSSQLHRSIRAYPGLAQKASTVSTAHAQRRVISHAGLQDRW